MKKVFAKFQSVNNVIFCKFTNFNSYERLNETNFEFKSFIAEINKFYIRFNWNFESVCVIF